MKHWLLLSALICFGSTANAGPYFRVLDINKLHKSAGAYIDPLDPDNTSAGTAVALVTHSVRDGGCLFPTIICEDWSPLTAGLSVKAGKVDLNLGPSVNLTPFAKAGAFAILSRITADDQLRGVKSALTSVSLDGRVPSVAFGPMLATSPVEGGRLLTPDKWRGRFRIFTGVAWEF